MKALLWFLMPGGMLYCASLILALIPDLAAHMDAIVGVYPPVVYVCAIIFGWRFNRSALVFGTLSIALVHWCLVHFSASGDMIRGIALTSAMLLLPLNLFILSLSQERGLFTARGIARLLFIPAQVLLVGIIAGRDPARYRAVLEQDLLAYPLLEGLKVPQIPLFLSVVFLAVIAVRYVRDRSAKESGFFWAIVMVLSALSQAGKGHLTEFHLASGAFILLVSIIEVSHAMAFRDELTGLPARRALREDLLKLGSEYCLAMVDIDHFKKFNDRHGHDVGDQVLRMVASRMDRVTGGGKAFRYGGEEFTVIFPGKYADDALDHLEALRKDVASAEFVIRSRKRPRKKPSSPRSQKARPTRVSVTISIGAAWPGGRHRTTGEVIKAADKALYRAKKQGRNRVST